MRLRINNPFLHEKLTRAFRHDSRVGSAIDALNAGILLKPDQYGFHEQLGDLLLQQQDIEGAIASYEKAIALNTDLPKLKEKLNMTLQQQTNPPESLVVVASDNVTSSSHEQGHGQQLERKGEPEGVGGYDENIPKPVKKILMFSLLGFYRAIVLVLFLKGLTMPRHLLSRHCSSYYFDILGL